MSRGARQHLQSFTGLIYRYRLWFIALLIFAASLIIRLPYISHGIDQWDAVLYKNSLVDMKFYREAQWPLLLLFQKGLWLVLPHSSPQVILSLTSAIFSAGALMLFFLIVYKLTKSYLAGLGMVLLLFFIPLFGVYSVVGMQDMAQTFAALAFAAAIMQLCYTKSLRWLYAASLVAGLSLGVRLTLILTIPALALAMLMTRLNYKVYLRALAAFGVGAFFGLVGDLFIPPLPHSSPSAFFIGLFHMFNPTVLGYWKKAGGYTLMSGDKLTIFYWLPTLWLVVYVLSKRRKDSLSLAPLIALVSGLVSLAVAYGMSLYLKSVAAGSPGYTIFLLQLILIGGLLVYEMAKFGHKLPSSRYLKQLQGREKFILSLSLLILGFIAFNYIFVAGSTRYVLLILPLALVLILAVAGQTGWKSAVLVLALIVFNHWGCGFRRAQAYASTFKQLDTRSAVAEYALSHSGRYYDLDATITVVTYMQSYGAGNRLYGPSKGNWCASVDTSKRNYAILYGDITDKTTNSCPKVSFVRVAKFQRNENIIEDSVGNTGFTIYKMLPTS